MGAPEAIADLCHMTDDGKRELARRVARMAGDGLRVQRVARSQFRQAELPGQQHDFVWV